MEVCLITYTTQYRTGGSRLTRVAETLAADRAQSGAQVRLTRVESKAEFLAAIGAVRDAGDGISELHFVGHSGMYGPMFRTRARPEQVSPHEWRCLSLPFTKDGAAYFHACRTARWFAPFFSRTFGVPAYGHHDYTTFSLSPEVFKWDAWGSDEERPLYLIACPGMKSHGALASAKKYLGKAKAVPMKRYEPMKVGQEATYEEVAELYDEVFSDIRVREDEWRWIEARVPHDPDQTLLDIGCGNGALLHALAPRIGQGIGLDTSAAMLKKAAARCLEDGVSLHLVDGPHIPLEDSSVDMAISLLSFRYLDWDPLMDELRRVLRPGGRFLVVDMVTATPSLQETPRAVADSIRGALQRRLRPGFSSALTRLVQDPRWATMLHYNPIRAEHEYVWYLESRFPGRRVEVLNIGTHARVLAFDSGPVEAGLAAPQSFP
jgi:ubiquinone/menaquinone biosynthesis C-methylase UbiE